MMNMMTIGYFHEPVRFLVPAEPGGYGDERQRRQELVGRPEDGPYLESLTAYHECPGAAPLQ